VIALLAGGASNKDIARELKVSINTVERHLVNIYAKLGVRGRAEATAFAVRNDLA
jgi:DNA-binding NarL/FixJ family response regulator